MFILKRLNHLFYKKLTWKKFFIKFFLLATQLEHRSSLFPQVVIKRLDGKGRAMFGKGRAKFLLTWRKRPSEVPIDRMMTMLNGKAIYLCVAMLAWLYWSLEMISCITNDNSCWVINLVDRRVKNLSNSEIMEAWLSTNYPGGKFFENGIFGRYYYLMKKISNFKTFKFE